MKNKMKKVLGILRTGYLLMEDINILAPGWAYVH